MGVFEIRGVEEFQIFWKGMKVFGGCGVSAEALWQAGRKTDIPSLLQDV